MTMAARDDNGTKKKPAVLSEPPAQSLRDAWTYLVMSTSLVSLRKIEPITSDMTATPIGYQRPK